MILIKKKNVLKLLLATFAFQTIYAASDVQMSEAKIRDSELALNSIPPQPNRSNSQIKDENNNNANDGSKEPTVLEGTDNTSPGISNPNNMTGHLKRAFSQVEVPKVIPSPKCVPVSYLENGKVTPTDDTKMTTDLLKEQTPDEKSTADSEKPRGPNLLEKFVEKIISYPVNKAIAKCKKSLTDIGYGEDVKINAEVVMPRRQKKILDMNEDKTDSQETGPEKTEPWAEMAYINELGNHDLTYDKMLGVAQFCENYGFDIYNPTTLNFFGSVPRV